jgi:succinate dehydrogenase / fumarate reductase iron-sulfur subunit
MLIDGQPRQACSGLVDGFEKLTRIEPLTKFPLVRALVVVRSQMFEDLKRTKCWIPIDGTYPLGEGPKMASGLGETGYPLSRCITCGNCLEICPKWNEHSQFVGAAIVSQVQLLNLHPTGAMHARERLDVRMDPGGIADCDNAKVCPKEIPLTESLAAIKGQVFLHAIKSWFGGCG